VKKLVLALALALFAVSSQAIATDVVTGSPPGCC